MYGKVKEASETYHYANVPWTAGEIIMIHGKVKEATETYRYANVPWTSGKIIISNRTDTEMYGKVKEAAETEKGTLC